MNRRLLCAGAIALAAALAATGCTGIPEGAAVSIPDSVQIIAHRGASKAAPENTVAAALIAWEIGADAVEADVRLTADGVPVVIHDSTTLRTTGVDLRVSATDYAVLHGLDPGAYRSPRFAGERIPSLEELLSAVPEGRLLYLEIKTGPSSVDIIASVVAASGTRDRIRIISFDAGVLERAGALLPDVPRYLLALSASPDEYQDIVNSLADRGFAGIDLYHRRITPELVRLLHENGLTCLAWTVDDPEEIARLAAMGVDGITTNRPERVR